MARIQSLFEVSGTVGDATFCRRNGKTFLRPKPSFSYERWKHGRSTARSRENALEFGGASGAAAMVHRQLRGALSGHLAPYAHNRLAATLRAACKRHRDHYPHPRGHKGRALGRFPAQVMAHSLTGLQLGKAAPHLTPDITRHKADDGTACYRITGLDRIAQSLPRMAKKGTARQIRIRLLQARLRDLLLEDGTYRLPDGTTPLQARLSEDLPQPAASRWFDTDLLAEAVPSPFGEGQGGACPIDIPAPPPPSQEGATAGDHIITLVVIEWRERHGTRSPRLLKDHTTALVIDATPVFPGEEQPFRRRQPRPRRHVRRILRSLREPVQPRPTPVDRLKAALSPLKRE